MEKTLFMDVLNAIKDLVENGVDFLSSLGYWHLTINHKIILFSTRSLRE
jgi:hypothetical protein